MAHIGQKSVKHGQGVSGGLKGKTGALKAPVNVINHVKMSVRASTVMRGLDPRIHEGNLT